MSVEQLSEQVEELAWSAAAANAPRIRKSDARSIAAAWREIRAHLPASKRVEDVDGWVDLVEAYGADQARGMLEAIAKFALWFEGFAFASLSVV